MNDVCKARSPMSSQHGMTVGTAGHEYDGADGGACVGGNISQNGSRIHAGATFSLPIVNL